MTVDFDDDEIRTVKYLVRQEVRRVGRKRASLFRKFGAEADMDKYDDLDDILDDIYIKLGGDPENISNVQQ